MKYRQGVIYMRIRCLLALLTAFLMIGCSAQCEGIDWSSMDDSSIYQEIENARAELLTRGLMASGDTVLLQENDLLVTMESFELVENYMGIPANLKIQAVAVNNADVEYKINLSSSFANGWDVGASGGTTLPAGHKAYFDINLHVSDAKIMTLEALENVEVGFMYYDTAGSMADNVKSPLVTVYFK